LVSQATEITEVRQQSRQDWSRSKKKPCCDIVPKLHRFTQNNHWVVLGAKTVPRLERFYSQELLNHFKTDCHEIMIVQNLFLLVGNTTTTRPEIHDKKIKIIYVR
jgi:hypothetical protein